MMAGGETMTDDSKNTPSTSNDQAPAAETSQSETVSRQNAVGDGKRSPGVDVQAYIGRQLRAVDDDVAKQPVPERFLDLMKQLEDIKPRN